MIEPKDIIKLARRHEYTQDDVEAYNNRVEEREKEFERIRREQLPDNTFMNRGYYL